MKIKVTGTKELAAHCKEAQKLEQVRRVVAHHSAQLDNGMKRAAGAAFVKGYSTGDTARSIMTVLSGDGLESRTAPTTEYASYIEYGTRYMSAEPYVRPSFNAVKGQFVKDIETVMK